MMMVTEQPTDQTGSFPRCQTVQTILNISVGEQIPAIKFLDKTTSHEISSELFVILFQKKIQISDFFAPVEVTESIVGARASRSADWLYGMTKSSAAQHKAFVSSGLTVTEWTSTGDNFGKSLEYQI